MNEQPKVSLDQIVASYKQAIKSYFNIDPEEFQVGPDDPDYIYYQTALLNAINTIQQINLEQEMQRRKELEEQEESMGFDNEATSKEEFFLDKDEIETLQTEIEKENEEQKEPESNVVQGDFGKK